MAIYKLSKPTMINGEEMTEISYDIEGLTGNDVAQAIKDLAKQSIVVTLTETDQNYHAALFAIASGLDYMDIRNLPLKDFMKVCNIVRDFFLEE